MSWIPDVIKRVFSSSAAGNTQPAPDMDPASIMLTRHKLDHMAADPSDAHFDWYVPARSFLRAVEHNAEGSSLDHLLGSAPETIKTAARVALLNSVVAGKCPFFYQKHGNNEPVHVEDMYVPVTALAKHALALLDNTRSATLPAIYATALKDMDERRHSRAELADRWHLDFVDLKDHNNSENFELAVSNNRTVLCPVKKFGHNLP